MTPAELYDDHRRRPRNLGKLSPAAAAGDVGSIVIGDALRFYIGVDKGRVSQARFQVFNCQDQIAATSALTELVAGKTLADAKRLTARQVADHLGGLDWMALPVQVWGIEALRTAIAAYEGGSVDYDREGDPLLCRCHNIAEETVRQAIIVNQFDQVDAVVAATKAGSGCGSCRVDIARLLEERKTPATTGARAGGAAADGATNATRAAGRIPTLMRIQSAVDSAFLPAVRAAGGDLELWDFDGRTVRVRCSGTLSDDADARRTRLGELEALLRSEIDPGIAVADG